MLTTYTSVLARRVRIDADYATFPFEAAWASEAIFFVQVEGSHPDLSLVPEISPDGINWIGWGATVVLARTAGLAAVPLRDFGTWIRLAIKGASPSEATRVLVHLTLKG